MARPQCDTPLVLNSHFGGGGDGWFGNFTLQLLASSILFLRKQNVKMEFTILRQSG
jgi:hypothetical protein